MNRISTITIVVLLALSSFFAIPSYASTAHFSKGDAQASIVIGQKNFADTTSSASQSGLEGPLGICFDESGNLWVADTLNNRVLEYIPPFVSGMKASLVLGQPDFNSNQARTGSNGLSNPSAVACGESRSLWIADTGNNRVLEFSPPFTNGMNSSLVVGEHDFSSRNSSTSAAGFDDPLALAVDSQGNLWVADFGNNRVMEFKAPFSNGMNAYFVFGGTETIDNQTGGPLGELKGPDAIAFDLNGSLWISDGGANRILRFNPPFASNMSVITLLGEGQSGARVSQNSVTGPHGIAFDQSDNLWVADFFNDRVLKFAPPFSTGMGASLVIGQANFAAYQPDEVGPSGLNGPADVAFDSHGNLWVVDYHNNRIVEFPNNSLSGANPLFGLTSYLIVATISIAIFVLSWFALSHHRRRTMKKENSKSQLHSRQRSRP